MPSNVFSTDREGILEGFTPAEQYDQSDEEKKLVKELNSRFEDSRRAKAGYEQQWDLNRWYLRGYQFIMRNRTTDQVFRLPQEDVQRLFAIDNILRPTHRSLLGKLTRVVPGWSVIPASNDLVDLRGATASESLLRYHFRINKLSKTYIDWYRDVCTFGSGLFKLWWDSEKGRNIYHCEECDSTSYEGEDGQECPECAERIEDEYSSEVEYLRGEHETEMFANPTTIDEFEEPEFPKVPTLKMKKEGDIAVDVIDPRDFFQDPGATTLEEAQWVLHRVPTPINEIRKRFEKGKYVQEDRGIYSETRVSLQQGLSSTTDNSRQFENHAYLNEFHEKPTEEHPYGRIIWMSSDIILRETDDKDEIIDYELNRFPFYHADWERNKGEYWGESWIEQAWPLQREYNMLLTQMREQRELTNRPKLLAPMGSGIPIEEIDTTAGQIIYYNAMRAAAPKFLDIPTFPSYTYSEVERFVSSIRLKASVTEQEWGITSSEASGRYAAILESQSDQQVGPVLRYNSGEWVDLGRGILILCQSRYTDNRKWAISGFERPMIYEFNDINLSPGWDIEIQEEDSLSSNKAVRFQQVGNLVQTGYYSDPTTGAFDKKSFAKDAGLKPTNISTETDTADHMTAAGIPEMLRRGQQYEPKPWDNPDIFAEELDVWLKGPGRNPNEEPQLIQQVADLWAGYVQLSQEALRQKQEAMAAQQVGSVEVGGDGGGGGVLSDARQIEQQADTAGEAAAQITTSHEG